MKPSRLTLTDEQFEDLWECVNRTQSTTKNVTVPKSSLFNLLRDHSTMYAECVEGGSYVQVKDKSR